MSTNNIQVKIKDHNSITLFNGESSMNTISVNNLNVDSKITKHALHLQLLCIKIDLPTYLPLGYCK